jgi:hypothetical protein
MKKIDLGQTISIVANIGVVAGIVFLGIEIRQNTQALEAEAYRELTDSIRGINELRFSGADLSLDSDPSEEGSPYIFTILRHGDLAFQHYELDMLSEERLASITRPLSIVLCQPAFRQREDFYLEAFVTAYQEYLHSLIEEFGC